MISKYPHLPSFHKISAALLGAASICFGLGQYKLSLNVTTRSGFATFKVIVIAAFVTIIYTRAYVWTCEVRATLAAFDAAGDVNFYRAGCAAMALMSIFNLALINDAAG